MELEMLKKFPLMTHWNNKRYWTGFVKVHNTLFRLAIKVPHYPSIKSAILDGDKDSFELLQDSGDTKTLMMKMLKSEVTLLQFLESFKAQVEKSIEGKFDTSIQVWDPQIYSSIVNELQKLGFENVPYLSKDLKEVHVNQVDPSGRSHIIRFFINHMYPRKGLKVIYDLPVVTTAEPVSWPNNILDCVSLFKKNLEKYDTFWTEMDNIDETVQVLDPFQPNRSHTHRRILMGDKVILQLMIDPLNPRGFPALQFYGPEKKTELFEDAFTKNCNKWTDTRSIIENVESILEITLPAKGFELITEDEVKCTICYMYELNGDPPQEVCACGSLFHSNCIYELFVNETADNIRRKSVDCPLCSREIPVTTR